jgi:hypothetical protein
MTDFSTPTAGPVCPPEPANPARGSTAEPGPAAGAQRPVHACRSCLGIDPDTCLFNSHRPRGGLPVPDCRAELAAVLRAAMAARRGQQDGDVWEHLADAVLGYVAGSGRWVERAVHEDEVRCLTVDASRAEDAQAGLMAHRDQLAAAAVRVLQMVDAWERRLPDTIRTTTAAAAVRSAYDGIPLPRTPKESP